MKILVTGIAGVVGRMLTARFRAAGHEVFGIDRRPWPDAPEGVELHEGDIRKRGAEDVFRRVRPDVVVHLATVTFLAARREERNRINLQGTRAIFEHCRKYGVAHAVFVGRHTIYGAGPDSPLYHPEDDPPMAVATYPELADLVAADLYANTALWRFPELTTTVLRTCYALGAHRTGALASYLAGPRVPMVIGFDPLFQFMDESDIVAALALTVERRIRGVFNVAGPQPVPLSVLVRETGRDALPLPELLFSRMVGRFGLPRLPKGGTSHVKYPVVVDDTAFRAATGFAHLVDEVRAMHEFRDFYVPELEPSKPRR